MGRPKKDNRWSDIDGGLAFILPISLLRHENCRRLSGYACKLLLDLARQYTGYNNGYLCASRSLMKSEGWRSAHTLQKATLECEHYRMLIRTQQGGLNRPNLHAFSWRRIDEKPGKPLDVRPSLKSPDTWKEVREPFVVPAPASKKKARMRRLKAA